MYSILTASLTTLKGHSHEIESILKELSYEIAMSMHDGTV